jgi:hypothetical protein
MSKGLAPSTLKDMPPILCPRNGDDGAIPYLRGAKGMDQSAFQLRRRCRGVTIRVQLDWRICHLYQESTGHVVSLEVYSRDQDSSSYLQCDAAFF